MADSSANYIVMHREKANNPQWKNVGKTHDWRNYVNDEIQAMWNKIDLLGRCVIVHMCMERADSEEWD